MDNISFEERKKKYEEAEQERQRIIQEMFDNDVYYFGRLGAHGFHVDDFITLYQLVYSELRHFRDVDKDSWDGCFKTDLESIFGVLHSFFVDEYKKIVAE